MGHDTASLLISSLFTSLRALSKSARQRSLLSLRLTERYIFVAAVLTNKNGTSEPTTNSSLQLIINEKSIWSQFLRQSAHSEKYFMSFLAARSYKILENRRIQILQAQESEWDWKINFTSSIINLIIIGMVIFMMTFISETTTMFVHNDFRVCERIILSLLELART